MDSHHHDYSHIEYNVMHFYFHFVFVDGILDVVVTLLEYVLTLLYQIQVLKNSI
jgi:hypothetical protein